MRLERLSDDRRATPGVVQQSVQDWELNVSPSTWCNTLFIVVVVVVVHRAQRRSRHLATWWMMVSDMTRRRHDDCVVSGGRRRSKAPFVISDDAKHVERIAAIRYVVSRRADQWLIIVLSTWSRWPATDQLAGSTDQTERQREIGCSMRLAVDGYGMQSSQWASCLVSAPPRLISTTTSRDPSDVIVAVFTALTTATISSSRDLF